MFSSAVSKDVALVIRGGLSEQKQEAPFLELKFPLGSGIETSGE